MRLVDVGDAELEVDDRHTGEPVLFIQTALTADELVPIADHTAAGGYRSICYHRRGYAGSSAATGDGSIRRDAADCLAVIDALRLDRAHVVGFSYSAAVALQLAADSPRVHTLVLLEPPPVHTASAAEFRAANKQLTDVRRTRGGPAALNEFLTRVIGADWRNDIERALPGAAAQMQRDVGTFFDVDLPALLAWRFTGTDAQRVRCPVLYVGGTASGPWFGEVRELILRWLPRAEEVLVDGADHSLTVTHSAEVARALVGFLRRHPLS